MAVTQLAPDARLAVRKPGIWPPSDIGAGVFPGYLQPLLHCCQHHSTIWPQTSPGRSLCHRPPTSRHTCLVTGSWLGPSACPHLAALSTPQGPFYTALSPQHPRQELSRGLLQEAPCLSSLSPGHGGQVLQDAWASIPARPLFLVSLPQATGPGSTTVPPFLFLSWWGSPSDRSRGFPSCIPFAGLGSPIPRSCEY